MGFVYVHAEHFPADPKDIINMTVDISERKKAELALAERNAQLALAGKVALVGSYAYDVNADSMRVSEGYAAIHGLPEGQQRRHVVRGGGGHIQRMLVGWKSFVVGPSATGSTNTM